MHHQLTARMVQASRARYNQLSVWLKPTNRTTRASHAHGACQRNAPCKPAGHAAQANHAHGACERSALQANRVHNTNQPSTPCKPAEHAINRPRATKGRHSPAASLQLWAMGYGPPSPPVFSSLVLWARPFVPAPRKGASLSLYAEGMRQAVGFAGGVV